MTSYRATWEIDVDGETPEDAAREALDIMTGGDGGTLYTFDMHSESGHVYRVTLDPTGDLVEWCRGYPSPPSP